VTEEMEEQVKRSISSFDLVYFSNIKNS